MLDFQFAIRVADVHPINPHGTVALCTLWTPPAYLIKQVEAKYPHLLNDDSPVAVVGKLYGGGLKIMLRNLHHNPQLDTVILCGQDFAGAGELLNKFFLGDYELTGKLQTYIFDDGQTRELETLAIYGEKSVYKMDSLILHSAFQRKPKIWELPTDGDLRVEKLAQFLSNYVPTGDPPDARPEPIPLPHPEVSVFPSERFGAMVVADTIVEAWREILWRLNRFGVPVLLRNNKERRELNNFKTVILYPDHYSLEELMSPPYNLKEEYIKSYQNEIIEINNRNPGIPYTYGNRIRAHFHSDLLDRAAKNLSLDRDSRHAFISLWDNATDIEAPDSPCLVSLFFR
jgi:thymidylate synthase